jgi:hypothetical protein
LPLAIAGGKPISSKPDGDTRVPILVLLLALSGAVALPAILRMRSQRRMSH